MWNARWVDASVGIYNELPDGDLDIHVDFLVSDVVMMSFQGSAELDVVDVFDAVDAFNDRVARESKTIGRRIDFLLEVRFNDC